MFHCDTGCVGRPRAAQTVARAVQPRALRKRNAGGGDRDRRLRAHANERGGISHLSARGSEQVFAAQGRGELLAQLRSEARLYERTRSARRLQEAATTSRRDRKSAPPSAQSGFLLFYSTRSDSRLRRAAARSRADSRPARQIFLARGGREADRTRPFKRDRDRLDAAPTTR